MRAIIVIYIDEYGRGRVAMSKSLNMVQLSLTSHAYIHVFNSIFLYSRSCCLVLVHGIIGANRKLGQTIIGRGCTIFMRFTVSFLLYFLLTESMRNK